MKKINKLPIYIGIEKFSSSNQPKTISGTKFKTLANAIELTALSPPLQSYLLDHSKLLNPN